jgi:hypothetical protein
VIGDWIGWIEEARWAAPFIFIRAETEGREEESREDTATAGCGAPQRGAVA